MKKKGKQLGTGMAVFSRKAGEKNEQKKNLQRDEEDE
jgi:hypothetical protein